MPTRYHLGLQAIATADAAGIIGALETLFAVATDVNSGDAVSGVLTWTRDSTAGSQALYSSAFGPNNDRIIIAVHDSGTPSPSPTMIASADTYTAANILIGLARNASGAYAGWNQAAPFTGCSFAGYYRLAASSAATSWRAMLSAKDVWLQYVNATGVQSAGAGAIIVAPAAYAESDGYRYGLAVSGAGDQVINFRSAIVAANGQWFRHTAAAGREHFGVYSVAGTTWQTCTCKHILWQPGAASTTADSSKFDNTTPAKGGIGIRRASAPEYDVGALAGVYESPLGLTGQAVTDGAGAHKAVRWSSSVATTDEESVLIARSY